MIKFETIGRLTKDPETRYNEEGKSSTTFRLATNTAKDETTFLNITTFGSTGELVQKYVKKGSLIFIEGTIRNNDYTDKEGKKHFEHSFIGQRVEFLSNKDNSIQKEESAKKNLKNELDDKAFEEFGKKIEIDDKELAF